MNTHTASIPFGVYTRVSTGAQAQSGLGLDAQAQAVSLWAALQQIETTTYTDAGVSGRSTRGRTGLAQAMADAKAGTIAGIVCAKLDRLARSARDVLTIVDRADREGWRLVVLDVQLDSGTPAGRMVLTIMAGVAEFESRRIGERVRESRQQLRAKGANRAHPPADRAVADRIIATRDAGRTWQSIADTLNTEGVATARGGTTWRPSSVRSAYLTRVVELDAQRQAGG